MGKFANRKQPNKTVPIGNHCIIKIIYKMKSLTNSSNKPYFYETHFLLLLL